LSWAGRARQRENPVTTSTQRTRRKFGDWGPKSRTKQRHERGVKNEIHDGNERAGVHTVARPAPKSVPTRPSKKVK